MFLLIVDGDEFKVFGEKKDGAIRILESYQTNEFVFGFPN